MARFPIIFGPYLLLERINVGGMAEVFRAKVFGIEGFERIVAVKRILPSLADDQAFIKMFIDEARIASQVSHQNIVQIYDLGRHDGQYFMAMEYVSGRDLRQILDLQKRRGELMPVARACHIISKVCEGLEYAHNKRGPAGNPLNIIHRDVTPQNIMCSYEGEVKLCDFGIAKAATRAAKKTKVGVLKGKFAYMSPEQVTSNAVDHRSDIFALGVIFYELLTGERLFLGQTDYSTLSAVRAAKIPPLIPKNPAISPQLQAVVYRMLARDPERRFQGASEVQEALSAHLVDAGRLFLPRHLRRWMQETYADELEAESVKLEAFMAVKRPPGLSTESELSVAGTLRPVGLSADPTEGPSLGGAAASVSYDPFDETPDLRGPVLAGAAPPEEPLPEDHPLQQTRYDPSFPPDPEEGDMTLMDMDSESTLEGSSSEIEAELRATQSALRSELDASEGYDLPESETEGLLTPDLGMPSPPPEPSAPEDAATERGPTRSPSPGPPPVLLQRADSKNTPGTALWASAGRVKSKLLSGESSPGRLLLLSMAGLLGVLLVVLLGLWVLRSPVAVLQISAGSPRDAEVWVDDTLISTELPATVKNLPLGSHRIRVAGEGLRPREEILELNSATTYTVDIAEE